MTTKLGVLATAALVAWGLKHHYAIAGADDLWWILAPTAHLAGVATGSTFVASPGEGFLAHERLFLIEKSCAGVNFLIAAFGMLVCAGLPRIVSVASGARTMVLSLVVSYVAAVIVNATRIAVAMWLAAYPAAMPALPAETIHRVEGIAVYFAGLLLLYELWRRLDRRERTVEAGR